MNFLAADDNTQQQHAFPTISDLQSFTRQGTLKQMIDSLYIKEKKFVYVNHHAKQECIGNKDPIFNLNDLPPIVNIPKVAYAVSGDTFSHLIFGSNMKLEEREQKIKISQKGN